MDVLSLILALIALVITIVAYHKVEGLANLSEGIDQISSAADLRKSVDSLTSATATLREKTIEAIGKLRIALRDAKEEKRPREGKLLKRPERPAERMPPRAKDFQDELEDIFASA